MAENSDFSEYLTKKRDLDIQQHLLCEQFRTFEGLLFKSVRTQNCRAVKTILDDLDQCHCMRDFGMESEVELETRSCGEAAKSVVGSREEANQLNTNLKGLEEFMQESIVIPYRTGRLHSIKKGKAEYLQSFRKLSLPEILSFDQNWLVTSNDPASSEGRQDPYVKEVDHTANGSMGRKLHRDQESSDHLVETCEDIKDGSVDQNGDTTVWNGQNFNLTRMCNNRRASSFRQYHVIKEKLHCQPQFQYIRSNYEKSKSYRALILAAQTGNAEIIQMFLARGFTIDDPHGFECFCRQCSGDPLGRSVSLIETYKAMTNPVWMSITAEDPFVQAFQYSNACGKLAKMDDAYEKVYHKLDAQCRQFCLDLLDQCRTAREQLVIMNMGELQDGDDEIKRSSSLKFVHLAIDYQQKEVVSHPIPQHLLTSLVFDNFPRWRISGPAYRVFFILTFSLLYPLTTVMHILFPCSRLGAVATRPLIKFINGSASFAYFLAFLAWLASSPRHGIRNGGNPTLLEYIILIWLISLLFAELGQLNSAGYKRYFSSGWNWIDISMIFLMLSGYLIWILLKFAFYDFAATDKTNLTSFADGLFASGIVLSFFRLVYLCQITRFLGLLQLCLGRMVQVIFQFAFISCVVLWSFSAGMVFLYYASASVVGTTATPSFFTNPTNKSEVKRFLSGGFEGLPATMVTLAWASMNMIGLESLKGFDDGSVTHLWSALLFTLYHGVSMIVLLNMLIAMMSNSYQQIENNIEVEHKFARTKLWVDYIGDKSVLPSPFNLIPSYPSIVSFFQSFRRICMDKLGKGGMSYKEDESARFADSNYKLTVRKLVRRYLKEKHNIHLDNKLKAKANIEKDDIFLTKVRKFLEEFSKTREQACGGICRGLRKTRDSGVDLTLGADMNVEEIPMSSRVLPVSEEDQESNDKEQEAEQ